MNKFGFSDYTGTTTIKNASNISSNNYMKYLSNDSIKLINKVYEIDFKTFGYDMIIV